MAAAAGSEPVRHLDGGPRGAGVSAPVAPAPAGPPSLPDTFVAQTVRERADGATSQALRIGLNSDGVPIVTPPSAQWVGCGARPSRWPRLTCPMPESPVNRETGALCVYTGLAQRAATGADVDLLLKDFEHGCYGRSEGLRCKCRSRDPHRTLDRGVFACDSVPARDRLKACWRWTKMRVHCRSSSMWCPTCRSRPKRMSVTGAASGTYVAVESGQNMYARVGSAPVTQGALSPVSF